MKHLFRSVGTRRILPVCGSVAGPLEEVPRACLLLQEGMRHRWQWGSPLANDLSPREVSSPQERQRVGPRLPRTRTLRVQKISEP